jgi:hypothetical protein
MEIMPSHHEPDACTWPAVAGERPVWSTRRYDRLWPSLCKNAKVAYIEERDFFGAAT